jgi:hypothetical protein
MASKNSRRDMTKMQEGVNVVAVAAGEKTLCHEKAPKEENKAKGAKT